MKIGNEQVSEYGGWVVIMDMPEQTQYDFKRAHLNQYMGCSIIPRWRSNQPQHLFSRN